MNNKINSLEKTQKLEQFENKVLREKKILFKFENFHKTIFYFDELSAIFSEKS